MFVLESSNDGTIQHIIVSNKRIASQIMNFLPLCYMQQIKTREFCSYYAKCYQRSQSRTNLENFCSLHVKLTASTCLLRLALMFCDQTMEAPPLNICLFRTIDLRHFHFYVLARTHNIASSHSFKTGTLITILRQYSFPLLG